MRKLRRLLFRFFGIIFLVIIGILIVKTFLANSKQPNIQAFDAPAIPQDVTAHLQSAIQIPTISNKDQIDTSFFLEFNDFLSGTFPHVDSILNHTIINDFSHIYFWKGKDESLDPILIIAHLDVVPIEESSAKDWKMDPFSGSIADGYIWGRGSLDDKLNVVGLMESAEILLEQHYRPVRSIYFAFGHDEEISGKMGAESIARHFKQQGIDFSYVLDEGSLVVTDALKGLNEPAALIGIAEKGYVSLELKVQLEDGGHSSMPPSSTAIGILSKAITQLEANPFSPKIEGLVGDMLDYLGPEMSFPYKTIFSNRWLFGGILESQLSASAASNALIRTTTSPTILRAGVKDNVLPSEAKATINFRIIPGESPETVLNTVKDIINDKRVSVSITDPDFAQSPSPISPVEGFGFNVLQTTVKEFFPEAVVAPSLVIAATDSRHYSSCADAIYRFMPIELKKEQLTMIHGINEKIKITDYHRLIQFYIRLIQNSCR